MATLPQTDTARRSPRLHLANSTTAVLRFEDGRRNQAQLQTVSLTGGLLRVPRPLGQGARVKLMFLTDTGAILGAAEMLNPVSWGLQPFRFTTLDEGSRRRLANVIGPNARAVLDQLDSAHVTHVHVESLPARHVAIERAPAAEIEMAPAVAMELAPAVEVERAPVKFLEPEPSRQDTPHAEPIQDIWIQKYRTAVASANEPRSGFVRSLFAVLMVAAAVAGFALYLNGFRFTLP